MQKADVANSILDKLTGKAIAGLIAFALLLVAGLLAIAVFRGSAVDLWGFKIEPRQNTANSPATNSPATKVPIRLYLDLDPPVNTRAPGLHLAAFMKPRGGSDQPLQLTQFGTDDVSGIPYLEAEVPDPQTTMYVQIETPRGIWKTDDFSLAKSRVRAFQLFSGQ